MTDLKPVRFGAFELDVHTRELRKHGIRIKLQEQPFQVLQALVERPGELVTREEIQRRIWSENTFVDIDQSLNRAVNKVREALGDTAESPRYIETMARRGYRFIGPVESDPKPVEPVAAPAPVGGRPWGMISLVAAGVLAVVGVGLWLTVDRTPLPAMRLVPLTTYAGYEGTPAFSPDGKHVAFTWDGEARDNTDVYVKMVGSVTPVRLTTDSAYDGFPAWSPDGRQIAFASWRDGGGIYLVSPGGGSQRKLADLVSAGQMAWTGDAKYLLVARAFTERRPENDNGAILLLPVDGEGAPRQFLVPPPGTWYSSPALAPGGQSLAFASCTGGYRGPQCSLQIVDLKGVPISAGSRRPIVQIPWGMGGLAWSPDGSSLVYSAGSEAMNISLWRVSVKGGTDPEKVELAGGNVRYPATDFNAGRLAFMRSWSSAGLWRLERGGKVVPFVNSSSTTESSPQFSPDGRRIAFQSNRQVGSIAVWVANSDGTEPAQVTNIASTHSGTPRWSPDGRWLAFDALRKGGGWDVWVVEASGGSQRQLTDGAAHNAIPSWSLDGKTIYFTSNRSGRFEIWRIPAVGGEAKQVTANGGHTAFESTDGKTLYYTLSEDGTEGIYAKSLPDGEVRQVVKERVALRGFAVFPDGVFYLHWRARNRYEIRFYEFASGQTRSVSDIEGGLHIGLTVSPDRKTFVFTKWSAGGSDLMLIENFR